MVELPNSIVWANNAPGSVAIADMNTFLKDRPVDAKFWEHEIIGAIHRWYSKDPVGRKKITIADLGFGVGGKLAYICDDSARYGLNVMACGVDLVPSNVDIARKTISEIAGVKNDLRWGDIRKGIPFDSFDFVLISEVAHWMSKSDFSKVMTEVSRKCTKDANVIVSYATPYNASALAQSDGSVDKRLVQKRRIKESGYSYSCKTNMSWYGLQEMFDIGKKAGLQPVFFEYIENKTFPSILPAGLVYRKDGDYYENEIIRFVKI